MLVERLLPVRPVLLEITGCRVIIQYLALSRQLAVDLADLVAEVVGLPEAMAEVAEVAAAVDMAILRRVLREVGILPLLLLLKVTMAALVEQAAPTVQVEVAALAQLEILVMAALEVTELHLQFLVHLLHMLVAVGAAMNLPLAALVVPAVAALAHKTMQDQTEPLILVVEVAALAE